MHDCIFLRTLTEEDYELPFSQLLVVRNHLFMFFYYSFIPQSAHPIRLVREDLLTWSDVPDDIGSVHFWVPDDIHSRAAAISSKYYSHSLLDQVKNNIGMDGSLLAHCDHCTWGCNKNRPLTILQKYTRQNNKRSPPRSRRVATLSFLVLFNFELVFFL